MGGVGCTVYPLIPSRLPFPGRHGTSYGVINHPLSLSPGWHRLPPGTDLRRHVSIGRVEHVRMGSAEALQRRPDPEDAKPTSHTVAQLVADLLAGHLLDLGDGALQPQLQLGKAPQHRLQQPHQDHDAADGAAELIAKLSVDDRDLGHQRGDRVHHPTKHQTLVSSPALLDAGPEPVANRVPGRRTAEDRVLRHPWGNGQRPPGDGPERLASCGGRPQGKAVVILPCGLPGPLGGEPLAWCAAIVLTLGFGVGREA